MELDIVPSSEKPSDKAIPPTAGTNVARNGALESDATLDPVH